MSAEIDPVWYAHYLIREYKKGYRSKRYRTVDLIDIAYTLAEYPPELNTYFFHDEKKCFYKVFELTIRRHIVDLTGRDDYSSWLSGLVVADRLWKWVLENPRGEYDWLARNGTRKSRRKGRAANGRYPRAGKDDGVDGVRRHGGQGSWAVHDGGP